MRKYLGLMALAMCFGALQAKASVRITPATGGGAISADTAANAISPSWTTLGPITIFERNNGARTRFAAGNDQTLVLKAPAGFEFNTAATPSISFTANRDISAADIVVASNTLTITYSVAAQNAQDSLVIGGTAGVQVRPTAGSPLASGNIHRPAGAAGGTGVVRGIVAGTSLDGRGAGVSNFGTLVETPSAAALLTFKTAPSSQAIAGSPFGNQPVVVVADQYGNVRTNESGRTVTASLASGSGALIGTATANVVGGLATFTNLGADTAGTITIAFASAGLTSVTSGPIVIDPVRLPPEATALRVATEPSASSTAGVVFAQQPVVQLVDQYDLVMTNDSTTIVTASRSAGMGDLQGTLSVQLVEGVATFNDLSHNTANSITLLFSSGSLIPAVSRVIEIVPSAATHLAFTAQPSDGTVGSPFVGQPTVAVQDAYGNASTNGLPSSLLVTLQLTSGTGPLQGIATLDVGMDDGAGIAVFSGLQIDEVGTNKQLTASATGLTNAVSAFFSVHNASQTITFAPLTTKTFGDAPFGLSATASSGLPVTFSVASGFATITNGTNVVILGAGDVTIRASQDGNDNYGPAPSVDRTFTVNKGNQTITFGALSNKVMTDAAFGISASSDSLLPVTLEVIYGSVTLSNGVVTLVGAGEVKIRASQSGNDNYNAATPVDQIFTVSKASQSITFAALGNKVYGDAPITLSATASSQLDVAFSVVSSVASLSGNTLTLNSVGGVQVTASQAGNDIYAAASDVQRSFQITPATLQIASTSTSRVYGEANPTFTGSIVGLKNGDNITATYSTTADANSAPGNYPITITLNDPNNRLGNYNVSTNVGTLVVTALALPVIDQSPVGFRGYQGSSFNLSLVASGPSLSYQWRQNGELITEGTQANYSVDHARVTHTGGYDCVVSNSSGSVTSAIVNVQIDYLPGDFNEDGQADLILQHPQRRYAVWHMDGTNVQEKITLVGQTMPVGWSLVGQHDFNADGHTDFLFQKTNGVMSIWLMNGTNRVQDVPVRSGQSSGAYRVRALSDVDQDGDVDIIFQNGAKKLLVWYMDGVNYVSSASLLRNSRSPAVDWRLVTARDFNGDEIPDLLLQHTDGRLAVWTMGANSITGVVALRKGAAPATGWKIVGCTDLDYDDDVDILWQNGTKLRVWKMNGTAFSSVAFVNGGTLPTGWRVVGAK